MNLHDKKLLREIGFRGCELRAASATTQADLADQCGLHRTFIGSVERGERNLSLLNLRLIARVLRGSLSDLFQDAS